MILKFLMKPLNHQYITHFPILKKKPKYFDVLLLKAEHQMSFGAKMYYERHHHHQILYYL